MTELPSEDALRRVTGLVGTLIDYCSDARVTHFKVIMADLHWHHLLVEILISLSTEFDDVHNCCLEALGVMCSGMVDIQLKVSDASLFDVLPPSLLLPPALLLPSSSLSPPASVHPPARPLPPLLPPPFPSTPPLLPPYSRSFSLTTFCPCSRSCYLR